MNFVKKILIVHSAASVRRRLMSLFASGGFDVRAFGSVAPATDNARSETFDLAIVGHGVSGEHEFSFIHKLKQIQSKLPVMLLVSKIEIMLVQDLQDGCAGMLIHDEEPRALLRQVRTQLNLAEPSPNHVSLEDMAQVESTLQTLAGQSDVAAAVAAANMELARERAELNAWRERLNSTEQRLSGDADRFRLESQHLAEAQQRFAIDMEQLRAEEESLRTNQQKLREVQEQFEAEARTQSGGNELFDPAAGEDLSVAWKKFQRATEMFEAERANLLDDKLYVQAQESELKKQEEKLRDREMVIAAKEKKFRESAPIARVAPTRTEVMETVPPQSSSSSGFGALTRGSLHMAKAVFGGSRKG
jgi:DNA-binding response OmpR family regulator